MVIWFEYIEFSILISPTNHRSRDCRPAVTIILPFFSSNYFLVISRPVWVELSSRAVISDLFPGAWPGPGSDTGLYSRLPGQQELPDKISVPDPVCQAGGGFRPRPCPPWPADPNVLCCIWHPVPHFQLQQEPKVSWCCMCVQHIIQKNIENALWQHSKLPMGVRF